MTHSPILITGGTGFAGSHLVENLVAKGILPHVTIVNPQETFVSQLLPPEHIHQVDLLNATDTAALLKQLQPKTIYHLAAFSSAAKSFDQKQAVLEQNLKLQLSFLEAIKTETPQARVLVVGSGAEYDTINHHQATISEEHPLGPASPYAISKVLQDMMAVSYAYAYGCQIIRVRPFNHIGERQGPGFAVPDFARQIVAIERGQQSTLRTGNLTAVRDFTDVKDMVNAYILVMEKGEVGQVYNIGSGVGISMQEIVEKLSQLSTATVRVELDETKLRPLDVPRLVVNNQKVRALGWQVSIPIDQTLARILEYWRQQI